MANWPADILDDPDVASFVEQMIDSVENPARGIAKFYIDKGAKALSAKQSAVIVQQILNRFAVERCTRCGNEVPWSEMFVAVEHSGLCGYCHHVTTKDD